MPSSVARARASGHDRSCALVEAHARHHAVAERSAALSSRGRNSSPCGSKFRRPPNNDRSRAPRRKREATTGLARSRCMLVVGQHHRVVGKQRFTGEEPADHVDARAPPAWTKKSPRHARCGPCGQPHPPRAGCRPGPLENVSETGAPSSDIPAVAGQAAAPAPGLIFARSTRTRLPGCRRCTNGCAADPPHGKPDAHRAPSRRRHRSAVHDLPLWSNARRNSLADSAPRASRQSTRLAFRWMPVASATTSRFGAQYDDATAMMGINAARRPIPIGAVRVLRPTADNAEGPGACRSTRRTASQIGAIAVAEAPRRRPA